MVKIAFLVSGGGTNLQAVIDSHREGKIKNAELSLVVSSKPEVYALERAKQNGIPAHVIDRKKYPDAAGFTRAVLDLLKRNQIELVVLAGFLSILTEEIVREFPNAMINVHPALIPSFCGQGFYGLRVHEAALEKGVKVTGATVHFVTGECDGGPIILQKAVDVLPKDTAETLQKRVMEQCERDILPKAVSLFCEGKLEVNGNIVRIV